MKIAVVGPGHPLRGGLSSFNHLLVQNLQKEGHDVELISFSLQYPSILFPGKTQLSDDVAPEGVKIKSLINSINPINWIRTGFELRKGNFDLVIFRFWIPFIGPSLGTISRIVGKKEKTRIVAIADNVIPHEKRPFDRVFARYFLSSCDGFLTMSKAVKAELNEWYPKAKVHFCPHPMYESFGPKLTKSESANILGLAKDQDYILFFGFIRDYKGLDVLLKAFSKTKVEAKLIIAGEFYTESSLYLNLIEELGLKDRVVLRTDFIPNNQVNAYFSIASLVAQTYKTATQSGVTQIAYYYETPMLVTNVGGLSELVPHGKVGFVCDVDEVEIAKSIDLFFTTSNANDFLENIKVERNRFKWSSFIEKLLHA